MKILIAPILFLIISCSNNRGKYFKLTKTNKKGNCLINTSEIREANGINMDVYYPCSWSEIQTDNYDPTVIKQVGDTPQGIRANIAMVFMIRKLKDSLTPHVFDSLRTEIYLRGNPELEKGTISSDTIEINGVKGGAITTRNILESGQVAYGLNIHLYFNNNLIQLRYVMGAPTENEAASFFDKQEPMLMALAKKTKFYNKPL